MRTALAYCRLRPAWQGAEARVRLEPPACEATASSERPRLVCDDALHLVVPAALGPCAACGRAFCRACHPDCCPKCGADEARPHGLSGVLRL